MPRFTIEEKLEILRRVQSEIKKHPSKPLDIVAAKTHFPLGVHTLRRWLQLQPLWEKAVSSQLPKWKGKDDMDEANKSNHKNNGNSSVNVGMDKESLMARGSTSLLEGKYIFRMEDDDDDDEQETPIEVDEQRRRHGLSVVQPQQRKARQGETPTQNFSHHQGGRTIEEVENESEVSEEDGEDEKLGPTQPGVFWVQLVSNDAQLTPIWHVFKVRNKMAFDAEDFLRAVKKEVEENRSTTSTSLEDEEGEEEEEEIVGKKEERQINVMEMKVFPADSKKERNNRKKILERNEGQLRGRTDEINSRRTRSRKIESKKTKDDFTIINQDDITTTRISPLERGHILQPNCAKNAYRVAIPGWYSPIQPERSGGIQTTVEGSKYQKQLPPLREVPLSHQLQEERELEQVAEEQDGGQEDVKAVPRPHQQPHTRPQNTSPSPLATPQENLKSRLHFDDTEEGETIQDVVQQMSASAVPLDEEPTSTSTSHQVHRNGGRDLLPVPSIVRSNGGGGNGGMRLQPLPHSSAAETLGTSSWQDLPEKIESSHRSGEDDAVTENENNMNKKKREEKVVHFSEERERDHLLSPINNISENLNARHKRKEELQLRKTLAENFMGKENRFRQAIVQEEKQCWTFVLEDFWEGKCGILTEELSGSEITERGEIVVEEQQIFSSEIIFPFHEKKHHIERFEEKCEVQELLSDLKKERQASQAVEKKAKAVAAKVKTEAEQKRLEELQRKAKEETERLAKEEAEKKARDEAEKIAKIEAQKNAKRLAARLSREEQLQKEKEAQWKKFKEEMEDKAREDAERKIAIQKEIIAEQEERHKAMIEAHLAARMKERKVLADAAKTRKAFELLRQGEAERKLSEEMELKKLEKVEKLAMEKIERKAQERQRLYRKKAELERENEEARSLVEEQVQRRKNARKELITTTSGAHQTTADNEDEREETKRKRKKNDSDEIPSAAAAVTALQRKATLIVLQSKNQPMGTKNRAKMGKKGSPEGIPKMSKENLEIHSEGDEEEEDLEINLEDDIFDSPQTRQRKQLEGVKAQNRKKPKIAIITTTKKKQQEVVQQISPKKSSSSPTAQQQAYLQTLKAEAVRRKKLLEKKTAETQREMLLLKEEVTRANSNVSQLMKQRKLREEEQQELESEEEALLSPKKSSSRKIQRKPSVVVPTTFVSSPDPEEKKKDGGTTSSLPKENKNENFRQKKATRTTSQPAGKKKKEETTQEEIIDDDDDVDELDDILAELDAFEDQKKKVEVVKGTTPQKAEEIDEHEQFQEKVRQEEMKGKEEVSAQQTITTKGEKKKKAGDEGVERKDKKNQEEEATTGMNKEEPQMESDDQQQVDSRRLSSLEEEQEKKKQHVFDVKIEQHVFDVKIEQHGKGEQKERKVEESKPASSAAAASKDQKKQQEKKNVTTMTKEETATIAETGKRPPPLGKTKREAERGENNVQKTVPYEDSKEKAEEGTASSVKSSSSVTQGTVEEKCVDRSPSETHQEATKKEEKLSLAEKLHNRQQQQGEQNSVKTLEEKEALLPPLEDDPQQHSQKTTPRHPEHGLDIDQKHHQRKTEKDVESSVAPPLEKRPPQHRNDESVERPEVAATTMSKGTTDDEEGEKQHEKTQSDQKISSVASAEKIPATETESIAQTKKEEEVREEEQKGEKDAAKQLSNEPSSSHDEEKPSAVSEPTKKSIFEQRLMKARQEALKNHPEEEEKKDDEDAQKVGFQRWTEKVMKDNEERKKEEEKKKLTEEKNDAPAEGKVLSVFEQRLLKARHEAAEKHRAQEEREAKEKEEEDLRVKQEIENLKKEKEKPFSISIPVVKKKNNETTVAGGIMKMKQEGGGNPEDLLREMAKNRLSEERQQAYQPHDPNTAAPSAMMKENEEDDTPYQGEENCEWQKYTTKQNTQLRHHKKGDFKKGTVSFKVDDDFGKVVEEKDIEDEKKEQQPQNNKVGLDDASAATLAKLKAGQQQLTSATAESTTEATSPVPHSNAREDPALARLKSHFLKRQAEKDKAQLLKEREELEKGGEAGKDGNFTSIIVERPTLDVKWGFILAPIHSNTNPNELRGLIVMGAGKEGSPSSKAQIPEHSIIFSVNGVDITSVDTLSRESRHALKVKLTYQTPEQRRKAKDAGEKLKDTLQAISILSAMKPKKS